MLLNHREIPTCLECQTWLYDKDWRRTQRGGKDVRRPAGASSPCWKCPKSEDKKTPNPNAEMQDRHYQALEFYYRIKAGMPMPNDAIVQWYCGLIRWTEDAISRGQGDLTPLVMALTGARRK